MLLRQWKLKRNGIFGPLPLLLLMYSVCSQTQRFNSTQYDTVQTGKCREKRVFPAATNAMPFDHYEKVRVQFKTAPPLLYIIPIHNYQEVFDLKQIVSRAGAMLDIA